jgi:hypothetical protein
MQEQPNSKQQMSIPDSPAMNFMDAPIPGSSLTNAPGSRPYERPPKYTKEDDAMYAVLESITKPEKGVAVGTLLEKGVYASDVANTILMGGVAQGKWTPDLAALMAKKVLGAVVAVGNGQGVKNMRYMQPKNDTTLDELDKLPSMFNKGK